MTIAAPDSPTREPVPLRLEGRAKIGSETVTRRAVPAEDMMQAFAYRHLVPSQQLLASVIGWKQFAPRMEIPGPLPIRIAPGGTAVVQVKGLGPVALKNLQFELNEPPKGITLTKSTPGPDGLSLALKADRETLKPGFADNLIIEGFTENVPNRPQGGPAAQNRRFSVGVLPAIPFEIVAN